LNISSIYVDDSARFVNPKLVVSSMKVYMY